MFLVEQTSTCCVVKTSASPCAKKKQTSVNKRMFNITNNTCSYRKENGSKFIYSTHHPFTRHHFNHSDTSKRLFTAVCHRFAKTARYRKTKANTQPKPISVKYISLFNNEASIMCSGHSLIALDSATKTEVLFVKNGIILDWRVQSICTGPMELRIFKGSNTIMSYEFNNTMPNFPNQLLFSIDTTIFDKKLATIYLLQGNIVLGEYHNVCFLKISKFRCLEQHIETNGDCLLLNEFVEELNKEKLLQHAEARKRTLDDKQQQDSPTKKTRIMPKAIAPIHNITTDVFNDDDVFLDPAEVLDEPMITTPIVDSNVPDNAIHHRILFVKNNSKAQTQHHKEETDFNLLIQNYNKGVHPLCSFEMKS